METPRNVILDLLPLYLAGELSKESHALVEKHLANDPQLAKLAKHPETMGLSEKIPVALTQNDELLAYKRAKQAIMWRTIVIGVVIAIFLLLVATMFFYSDAGSVPIQSEKDCATLVLPTRPDRSDHGTACGGDNHRLVQKYRGRIDIVENT